MLQKSNVISEARILTHWIRSKYFQYSKNTGNSLGEKKEVTALVQFYKMIK